MYAITSFSMKDISNVIKDFEKLPYHVYVRNRPKNEPSDSYFYLARQLAKCMMIADAFNLNIDPVRTEITGTQRIMTLQVFYLDRSKLKDILVEKTYCNTVLRMRANQKALLLMEVLRRTANQKVLTKVSTETMKKMQLMKQIMKNLWLHIIQSSMGRAILTYFSVVKIY